MKRRTKGFEQERLLLACQEALAEAMEKSGMTRTQLAEKLGINKSAVTRALSSGQNLTLASLAGFLWAMDSRIEPQLASLESEEIASTPCVPAPVGRLIPFPTGGGYRPALANDDDGPPSRSEAA